MDPQQQPGPYAPSPPAQPLHPAQYDFITNPVKPPKRSMFSGSNRTRTLLIIIGGLVLFMLVLIIGSSLFSSTSEKAALLPVAQQQSQVIAVAELGIDEGGTSQTQALASAVKIAVTSEQVTLINQMSKTDKVKPSEYASALNSQTKSQLETAQKNGRFDEAFSTVIKQELNDYQSVLKSASTDVSSKTTKTILVADYKNAGVLLAIPLN